MVPQGAPRDSLVFCSHKAAQNSEGRALVMTPAPNNRRRRAAAPSSESWSNVLEALEPPAVAW